MASYVALLAMIPSGLLAISYSYEGTYVPEQFSALDLAQIPWWDNHTVGPGARDSSLFAVKFFLPPINPQIEVWAYWSGSPGELGFSHAWVTWYLVFEHEIVGLNNEGHWFSKTELINAWNDQTNCSEIEGQCACGTVYHIFVTYNNTKYDSFAEAYDAQDVEVLIGVGMSDAVVKINAWNLVGQLLMFQLPGIPEPLNYFIALPFYACIGILTYILITMIIPFTG